MGKGDGRRVEDAAKIDANWSRVFGDNDARQHTTDGGALHDAAALDVRDVQIARHLNAVFPLIYAQIEKELFGTPSPN